MIKTPLSTVIGGAFWTPSATVIGGTSKTFDQLIKSIFANNEQGFFYDPNDLSAMFQDAAGNIPVTGVGQPVWHILDKSGNNNHAFATSSATRPILRQNATTGAYYLEFDGSDDFLQTANIDFTATDKISLFVGVRKLVNSAGVLCELSVNTNTEAGSFYITAPERSTGVYGFASKGVNATSTGTITTSSTSANDVSVLSAFGNISGGTNTIRRNAVSTTTAANLGTGNYGNHQLYIGRRGGTVVAFNGHIYGLIGVGRLTTESETTAIEKELAERTGVTLS